MICYIEHDTSVNKQAQKLSDIGRKSVKIRCMIYLRTVGLILKIEEHYPKDGDLSAKPRYTPKRIAFTIRLKKQLKLLQFTTPIMSCSAAEYAICRGQDIQTLHLKNIK